MGRCEGRPADEFSHHRYPRLMTIQPEPVVGDELRARLGLPPTGVKLDREQSLRLLDVLDAPYPPPAPHVEAWARQVLGLHAATA